MAQRPKKPDDATEEATMGIFPVGPSHHAPPSTSAELTPPPGGDDPSAPEPTLLAPSTQVPIASDKSETRTPKPPASPDDTAVARPGEDVLTPTPIPGSSSSASDSGESLGVAGKIQPGQTLFGRYLVDSMLGEGGMGTVWLVRHLELDSFRALKLIISGIAFDPQARSRFKREARVMARLSHPNAVVVHDARMGKDAAFIEMEYIRGQSLNKVMRTGVAMPLDWTARIVEQLCEVLQEAHDRKIVHRDLKPSNLMLVEGRAPGRELLKVLDFGIAKIIEAESEASGSDFRTNTGAFMGSALWTAPEQASGGTVDGRSDLYSVGIILYEMLTGYRPFSGQITKVIYNHLYTPPPKFAEKNPEVKYPPAIEQVVLTCLAKNPDERDQSARALGEAFLRAVPHGTGAPSSVSFAGADRLPSSSPLDSPATEMASASGLPATDPANPNFRRPPTPDHALEATWGGAATLAGPSTTRPGALTRAHTQVKPARWKALIPLAIMVGLLGLVVLLALNWKPRPTSKFPPGFTSEYAKGADTSALPAVLIHEPDKDRYIRLRDGNYHKGTDLDVVRFKFKTDNVLFFRLPTGYRPEYAPDAAPGDLPTVLIRLADGARFVHIPGGTFAMGNDFDTVNTSPDDEDQPAHLVTVLDCYIQESEVTNGQLEAYFIKNHVDLKDRPARWQAVYDTITNAGRNPKMYPAVGITHELASAYARSVEGLLTSEAQWEYAARSLGKKKRYVLAYDTKPSKRNANVESLGDPGPGMTTMEVGKYIQDRTEQGIHDLTGNAREFCRDIFGNYEATEQPVIEPHGPEAPKIGKRAYIIRGGSFATVADIHTTRPRRPDPLDTMDRANIQMAEDQTSDDVGFRVVLEWPRKP